MDIIILLSVASVVISIINMVLTQRRLSRSDTRDDAALTARISDALSRVERRTTKLEGECDNLRIEHARLDKEKEVFYRRLEKLDGLNLEAALAEIKTTMAHMKKLLEDIQKNKEG